MARLFMAILPTALLALAVPAPAQSLSAAMPGGALSFVETAGLAELIRKVRASDVFQSVIASDDWKEWEKTHALQEFNKSRKLVEFLLKMDMWEASDRLLGGRLAVATYPAGVEKDPDFSFLIRPSESSEWLAKRIRYAPIIRVGIKRVERRAFGEEVAAYRTRGSRDGATYFALNNGWVAIASSVDLLKKTVALQSPAGLAFEKGPALAAEAAFQSMTKRMGERHLARAFIDTGRIEESTGENLGLPHVKDDPVLALFIGGVVELVEESRFAGFTLDYDDKEVLFKAGIDARLGEISEQHRLFFAGSPEGGLTGLPKVPGYLGGFTLYRPFGDWYRHRDDAVQTSLIPGMKGFEGNVGDLLLGSGEAALLGDRIAFVSAQADDAGVDPANIRLPGFAFVVDLRNPDGADAALPGLFKAALAEIDAGEPRAGSPWNITSEDHKGVPLLFAKREKPIGDQPMLPAAARVGDHCVISSSRHLCRDLVELLQSGGPAPVKGKDLAFHLQFTELSKFFAANRAQYQAEFIRQGRTPIQAREDYDNLAKLMSGLESFSGESGAEGGAFGFTARGTLR